MIFAPSGGASCAIAMLHDYDRLFEDEPEWQARAQALSPRVIDFVTFMDQVAADAAIARPGTIVAQEGLVLRP